MIADTLSTLATQFSNATIGTPPSPAITSFDLTQLVGQVKTFLGQATQPLSLLSSFLSSASPTKFSNLIQLFFQETSGSSVSIASILKSMYTPIMAVGLAFYNIMQLIPANVKSAYAQSIPSQTSSNQLGTNQSSTTTQSVPLMKSASTTGGLTSPATSGSVTLPTIDFSHMTLTQWMALATYAFTIGGNVVKERDIIANAADREYDKDVEISGGYPTAYKSPQFFSAIGLMINGAIPAALATAGLEKLPGLDQGTKQNFVRLASVGYTRFAVGLMYMVILVFLNRNGPVSFPGVTDKNAQDMEDIFFALNLVINVWDAIAYQTIVDHYVQPGFDTTSRGIELSMKYLDMVRDIVILSTNNGQQFKGRSKALFLAFSYGFVTYKFVSLTLTMVNSYTQTVF